MDYQNLQMSRLLRLVKKKVIEIANTLLNVGKAVRIAIAKAKVAEEARQKLREELGKYKPYVRTVISARPGSWE